MSAEALELARRISHDLWNGYDDEFGYRTEKQDANANFNKPYHPDNIWSFWGQFDHNNQGLFTLKAVLAKMNNEAGATELYAWAKEQLAEVEKNVAKLHERGIEF